MTPTPTRRFVLDATCLINLHNHFSTRGVRRALKRWAQQNRIRVPEGVFRELKRKTDAARQTVETLARCHNHTIVRVETLHSLKDELRRVERAYGDRIVVGRQAYPGLWASASGRRAADGQVVAVAKKLSAVVVSDDKNIQRACLLENVECIPWTDFARRLGLVFQPLLPGLRS